MLDKYSEKSTMAAIEPSALTCDDVEILQHETVYRGYFTLQRYQLRHRQFKGGWGEAISRELLVRPQVVAVLPYDPQRRQLVLIEQFRTGALEDARSPWMIELVAGLVEAGETVEAVARREAQEEAGLTLTDLRPICQYWSSPGGSSERVALFCGRVDASQAGGIFGVAHEHEDIRSFVVDVDAAFAAMASGLINNAMTIIALQWLQLNINEIK